MVWWRTRGCSALTCLHFLRINAVSRGRWHDTREELFFLSPVINFLPGRLAALDFSHTFVRALLNPNRTASRVFFGPSTSLPPAILRTAHWAFSSTAGRLHPQGVELWRSPAALPPATCLLVVITLRVQTFRCLEEDVGCSRNRLLNWPLS